ncbi:MAG: PDZ domain-containing protein [Sedimentisphaerales bacterium]|nr:PDZ domain-containing protein [Sedimentisphaerales bacterium]
MKTNAVVTKLVIGLVVTLLLAAPVLTWADENQGDSGRSYLGVQLSSEPLPELLVKHLQLAENQGLLVIDVQKESAADVAGIVFDDIIVALNGRPVDSYEDFADQVSKVGVGTEIQLEIIHQGQRKTVTPKLTAYGTGKGWKFPENRKKKEERYYPGRAFRMDPHQDQWQQVPFDKIPGWEDYFDRHFKQSRTILIDDGQNKLEITIEGNPNDPDAEIIVKDLEKDTEHHVTVKTIDELPEKFRQPVRDALQGFEDGNPGDDSMRIPFNLPDSHGPGREYRYKFRMPNAPQPRDEDRQQQLNEQMEELRRRQEQSMQELSRDLIERLERMELDQQKLNKKLEKLQKKLSKKDDSVDM